METLLEEVLADERQSQQAMVGACDVSALQVRTTSEYSKAPPIRKNALRQSRLEFSDSRSLTYSLTPIFPLLRTYFV
eukprot:9305593-Pyramimonas_sp.AAC.1